MDGTELGRSKPRHRAAKLGQAAATYRVKVVANDPNIARLLRVWVLLQPDRPLVAMLRFRGHWNDKDRPS